MAIVPLREWRTPIFIVLPEVSAPAAVADLVPPPELQAVKPNDRTAIRPSVTAVVTLNEKAAGRMSVSLRKEEVEKFI
jgi:hypothetical protein